VAVDFPPWEPPIAGTETEHLVGMLERLRATFRWKADGLDVEGLRFRLEPSALSLGGLLKHLALVEDDKFSWCMLGERPITRTSLPEGTDVEEWQFLVGPDETPAQLYAWYDDAVIRAQANLARIVAEGRLDEPSSIEFEGMRPSNRRFLCDIIEEYGRHTGHADLIREALDGRVGEDPPWD
jgi:Protein of unknown function (DUF664)